jgi:Fe/S biogenesis protein NfuA
MSVPADPVVPEPVLKVTNEARSVVKETRANEDNPDRLALFIEVSGQDGGIYTYDMWFEAAQDAGAHDIVQHHDDLVVVIVEQSVEMMRGATLDVGDAGLAILNPNTPPVRSSPDGEGPPRSDLSSPIEQAVLEVLENEVNPQIAMHGGRADLVAVDEGVAYLRLSGGCQGCGLAEVTLTQGIAVAIREAVPQIIEVVDVTAHGEGSNPYFEAAKK